MDGEFVHADVLLCTHDAPTSEMAWSSVRRSRLSSALVSLSLGFGPSGHPRRPPLARDRKALATRDAAAPASSCSQNLSTFHPMAVSWALVSLSRATFPLIFARHQAAFSFGQVPWTGQACQKQPSTKTATLAPLKARSALRREPGNGQSTRKRKPSPCTADRSASSQEVSRRRVDFIRCPAAGDDGGGGVPRRRLTGTLDVLEPLLVELGEAMDGHLVVVDVTPLWSRGTFEDVYGAPVVSAVD